MCIEKRHLIGAAAVALSLISSATGAPPLSTVQDVLYQANGRLFNGAVGIQWKSFEAGDQSPVSQQSTTIQIPDGVLRTQLVPTTNAAQRAYYEVRFHSGGRTQWIEYWAVPPSSTPLRLRDIRITNPLSTVPPTEPPVDEAILIDDVSGLRDELDARPTKSATFTYSRAVVISGNGELESATGDPGDCIRVDGTSGPCGSTGSGPAFVDGEVPGGTIDGVNVTFTLASEPLPPASLMLYRNGVLQGTSDYTLLGSVVLFNGPSVPRTGDTLQASYRLTTAESTITFVDGETPSGLIDGVNTSFLMSSAPAPASTVQLFRNGLLQRLGADYTMTDATIAFSASSIPRTGDSLQVYYRK
jgi:hypothetical protein